MYVIPIYHMVKFILQNKNRSCMVTYKEYVDGMEFKTHVDLKNMSVEELVEKVDSGEIQSETYVDIEDYQRGMAEYDAEHE